jgi:hypothetical protein
MRNAIRIRYAGETCLAARTQTVRYLPTFMAAVFTTAARLVAELVAPKFRTYFGCGTIRM